jgi:hypothetical protein
MYTFKVEAAPAASALGNEGPFELGLRLRHKGPWSFRLCIGLAALISRLYLTDLMLRIFHRRLQSAIRDRRGVARTRKRVARRHIQEKKRVTVSERLGLTQLTNDSRLRRLPLFVHTAD